LDARRAAGLQVLAKHRAAWSPVHSAAQGWPVLLTTA
jgi:hypothetical protein